MKQICRFLSIAAMAALAFSACTEELNNDNINGGKTVTVHFGTENTDPTTKATLTPNEGETAFQADWENEDEIKVEYSNDNGDGVTGTTTATWNGTSFESTMPEYTGMWIYDAAYPVPSESDNSVDFGPNRIQKGNAYNSKYDIMIGSAVAENAAAGKDDAGKDIVFMMTRQTAIAYFHFASELNEAVTSATLTVSGEGAAIASNYAYVSDFAWAPAKDCQSITITFPEEAPNAQDFQLWFNVLPTSYESMTLTVETATKTFTISKSTDGLYEAGKLYKVKKSDIAWTDKGGSSTPATHVSVVNVDNVNAVKEMGNGSYGDYKDIVQTITVDGLEYSMTNICANSKNGQDGYLMAAKQFIQMKKSTSYIFNTKDEVTNIKVWVLPATTNAISVYQGSTSNNISTLINNPNKTTETVKLVSNSDSEVDTQLDVYEYTITDGFFKLAPSAILWVYKLEVTYSNSGSSEPAPETFSVSCATVTGGTLSATPSKAEAGAEVTLTATPDEGYKFNDDWTVTTAETSESITVKDGKFTMPAANVNVYASFTQNTYTITANTAENGTYTVKVGDAEVTSAVKGAKVLLEATPAEGYICDGWTVLDAKGNRVTVSNNSFFMPASAVTISTSFSLKPVDITYDHAGTAEDPYSVADVLKYITTLGTATSTNDVYAKGVITSITEVSTKYGNATYTIKDEGVENEVLVFRGLYLDGADFTSEDQIRVGDEVVVKGKVKNYNDTPEFDSGNSLVSYLSVSASKTSIAAAGETVTITVDTNVDSWKATSNNADFVVGTPSGNTVDVVVSKNTDASERKATITITAGDLSKTITLTQSAAGAVGEETVEKTSGLQASTTATAMNSYISYKNSAANNYSDPMRIYQDATFTISATNAVITKVEFTCDTKDKNTTGLTNGTVTVDSGATSSMTANGDVVTYTITGSTTSFKVKASAQFRVSGLKVTYKKK